MVRDVAGHVQLVYAIGVGFVVAGSVLLVLVAVYFLYANLEPMPEGDADLVSLETTTNRRGGERLWANGFALDGAAVQEPAANELLFLEHCSVRSLFPALASHEGYFEITLLHLPPEGSFSIHFSTVRTRQSTPASHLISFDAARGHVTLDGVAQCHRGLRCSPGDVIGCRVDSFLVLRVGFSVNGSRPRRFRPDLSRVAWGEEQVYVLLQATPGVRLLYTFFPENHRS